MSTAIDRIAIYQRLVAIKPFFEDVEKIKERKSRAKEAYVTERKATLVQSGGVWHEHITGGSTIRAPRFLLY